VKPRVRRSRLAGLALFLALAPMWAVLSKIMLFVLFGEIQPPTWVGVAENALGWVVWLGPVMGLVLGTIAQVRIERSKGAMRGGLQCAFAIAIGLMVIVVLGVAYLAKFE